MRYRCFIAGQTLSTSDSSHVFCLFSGQTLLTLRRSAYQPVSHQVNQPINQPSISNSANQSISHHGQTRACCAQSTNTADSISNKQSQPPPADQGALHTPTCLHHHPTALPNTGATASREGPQCCQTLGRRLPLPASDEEVRGREARDCSRPTQEETAHIHRCALRTAATTVGVAPTSNGRADGIIPPGPTFALYP